MQDLSLISECPIFIQSNLKLGAPKIDTGSSHQRFKYQETAIKAVSIAVDLGISLQASHMPTLELLPGRHVQPQILMLLGICDGNWNEYGIGLVWLRLRISISISAS